MLLELDIKHRYTKPYRPQTNGKVERFWRTLENELIDGTDFNTIDEFKKELMKYLVYYNEHRSLSISQIIRAPKEFLESLKKD